MYTAQYVDNKRNTPYTYMQYKLAEEIFRFSTFYIPGIKETPGKAAHICSILPIPFPIQDQVFSLKYGIINVDSF